MFLLMTSISHAKSRPKWFDASADGNNGNEASTLVRAYFQFTRLLRADPSVIISLAVKQQTVRLARLISISIFVY